MSNEVAILSGRYELVHPGHVRTIRRLAGHYGFLFVYVVDNPKTAIPSKDNAELLSYCVRDLGNVEIVLDPCHFGYATQEDLDRLPAHEVFLCGNPAVAKHLRDLGETVVCFSLSPGYSSTERKEKILAKVYDDAGKSECY